jgi:hypothetical protein
MRARRGEASYHAADIYVAEWRARGDLATPRRADGTCCARAEMGVHLAVLRLVARLVEGSGGGGYGGEFGGGSAERRNGDWIRRAGVIAGRF